MYGGWVNWADITLRRSYNAIKMVRIRLSVTLLDLTVCWSMNMVDDASWAVYNIRRKHYPAQDDHTIIILSPHDVFPPCEVY